MSCPKWVPRVWEENSRAKKSHTARSDVNLLPLWRFFSCLQLYLFSSSAGTRLGDVMEVDAQGSCPEGNFIVGHLDQGEVRDIES